MIPILCPECKSWDIRFAGDCPMLLETWLTVYTRSSYCAACGCRWIEHIPHPDDGTQPHRQEVGAHGSKWASAATSDTRAKDASL